jgi:hypothetical protein
LWGVVYVYIETTTYCSDSQAFIVVIVTQRYLQLVEDNMMLWEVVVQDTHVLARRFVVAMEGWTNAERCMLSLNVLECP